MKKGIILALAGAMVFSTPVMAKEVGAPEAVYLEDSSYIGINSETVLAIGENKTIHEHTNNAVNDIWDMDGDKVQNLAIGKGAVLDGKEAPGLTFELLKPELKRVYAAKDLAKDKGTLLTVANVHTHAGYKTAKITFYAPGVKADDAITVYQRVTDDNWTAVPTVVSDDHVTVEITDNTHLAFIKAPVATVVTEAPKAAAAPAAAVTEEAAAKETVKEATVETDAKSNVTMTVEADAKTGTVTITDNADAKADEKADADAKVDEKADADAKADEKADAKADEKADAAVKAD